MDSLLNETQISERFQVSLACLRKWRLHGRGPQLVRSDLLAVFVPKRSSSGLRNCQQESMSSTDRSNDYDSRLPASALRSQSVCVVCVDLDPARYFMLH